MLEARTRSGELLNGIQEVGGSTLPGSTKRPQFDALCKAAARREFDVAMAWSVDRLGRA